MKASKKILLIIVLLVAVATSPYQALRKAHLDREASRMADQNVLASSENDRLRESRQNLRNDLAALEIELEELRRQTEDIHKLRGEVALVRTELAEAKTKYANKPTNDAALDRWTDRIRQLKGWLAQNRDKEIPEFKYLTPENWLDVVRDTDLSSEEDLRFAAEGLRQRSSGTFADHMCRALDAYLKAENDELPKEVRELHPYFDHPVEIAMLDRYTMLTSGRYDPQKPNVIGEKEPVDDDRLRKMIGRNGWFHRNWPKKNEEE